MKLGFIFRRNKKEKLVEKVKNSLGANPKRGRNSTKNSTKGGKHTKVLSSSQRRKLAIERARREEILNPWMAF